MLYPLTGEEEAEVNGMRNEVQKAYDEEQKEANKPWWQKAGEFALDMVPIVGPVVSLAKNVSEGNWGMAALDVGFLALDVAGLVATPFTGGASLAASTAAKAGLRATVKGAAKAVAKKVSKEAIKAGAKQTAEMLAKLSVKNLTKGKLCVFACFPAGTPVAVKDGYRNIEEIRTGDEVWAWDEVSGELGLKKVLSTLQRDVHALVELTIAGETIYTTPEHPFLVDGKWKEAGLLDIDEQVQLFTSKQAWVESVQYTGAYSETEALQVNADHEIFDIGSAEETEHTTVYNLEVEGFGTYFVGWLKALVHNAGVCLKTVLKEIAAGKKKLRLIMLGKTPGKASKTGREVFDRMMKTDPPTARITKGVKEFLDSDGQWRNIKEADMCHIEDAVKWWNREGRQFGARSEEVRKWMLNSENYVLDYFKTNRSQGGKIVETYLNPLK